MKAFANREVRRIIELPTHKKMPVLQSLDLLFLRNICLYLFKP